MAFSPRSGHSRRNDRAAIAQLLALCAAPKLTAALAFHNRMSMPWPDHAKQVA